MIDILESELWQQMPEVLRELLRDYTTGRNIFWATGDYEQLGEGYGWKDEITPERITGEHGGVVKPRVLKTKEQQTDRSKDMAEVFTPVWVVGKMVDYVDIDIDTLCLELTCGEAPFLVSRYDAATGEAIPIGERVGVIDRKMRMVNQMQLSDEEWLEKVRLVFRTTYGYEWQGDNLLIARENMVASFVDYYEERFGKKPEKALVLEMAKIAAWNLWQMDGLTYQIPQKKDETKQQDELSLFGGVPAKTPAPLCKIKDWKTGRSVKVIDSKLRETKTRNIMKFDVIIGNPPYQEETESDSTRKPPVFNFFMDEAYKRGKAK